MSSTASETSDGPILNVINKRLRSLRKKLSRILQMEQSLSTGKSLNQEQHETLHSKPLILATIDELERLRQPLTNAITEEIKINNNNNSSAIEDLLNVIYFGNMFKTDFVMNRARARDDCMMMEDNESTDVIDLLSEKDLDLISTFSELLICRPVESTLSHKDAVRSCIEHAKLWVTKSDRHIGPQSDATYAGLRSKLNKIMSSSYFTTEPVFREEQAVAEHESCPVPVEETVVPTLLVESPVARYQEKEEEHVNSQADKSNEIHDSSAKELHQEENLSEQHAEPEEVGHEEEGVEDLKDANFDNQQSFPRRSHRNYRGKRGGGGGGHRGYSNGRGRGRFYHDDHNPYYDQPGNYYPRNYTNYRGRGGRGSRGGGNYSRYASGDQAGNVPAVS